MAQVISRVCDVCNLGGQRVPAVITVDVTYGPAGTAVQLDLCDNCQETFWKPVVEVLDQLVPAREPPARTGNPGPASTRASREVCPDCGLTSPSLLGLAMHRSMMHGWPPWRDDTTCPYCGSKQGALKQHVLRAHRHQYDADMRKERADG